MSFTGTQVEANARVLANDVEASSWTVASKSGLLFINEGVRDVYSQHPESRLLANGTLQDYTAMSALTETVALDDHYFIPLVEYYLMRFFTGDAGDTRDEDRMKEHRDNFSAFFKED